jgi:hypothetical protein
MAGFSIEAFLMDILYGMNINGGIADRNLQEFMVSKSLKRFLIQKESGKIT